jgi:hypothetical protein
MAVDQRVFWPGGIRVGAGVAIPLTGSGAAINGQIGDVQHGSTAANEVITTDGPTFRIARVEKLNGTAGPGTKLTNEKNAALVVTSSSGGDGVSAAGTFMQANALFAYAEQTDVSGWDAVAINAVGRARGTSQRRGTAAYLEGRMDVSGAKIIATEIRANNQNPQNDAADGTYTATGASATSALWVSAQAGAPGAANPVIAEGIGIGSADGTASFGVGIGFKQNGVTNADIRSDSSAPMFADVRGTRTVAIDFINGTFSTAVMRLPNTGVIAWRNAAGSGNILGISVDSSDRINLNASAGVLITNLTNLVFSTGTGSQIATATTQKIGFWGKAPTGRPTGWTAWTGTATRTTFATSTATLANVAEAVKALIDDLILTGLIG